MKMTERDLDKRTVRRDLERGRLNEADLIEAIDALPDVADNIAPPESDEEAAAPAPEQA